MDFYLNPGPDPCQNKFLKEITKCWETFLVFNQKSSGSLYFCFYPKKLSRKSENHENLVEQVDFYSSVSLARSGSQSEL